MIATQPFQFRLGRIFLITALVALGLATRDDAAISFLCYLICNALACVLCFGVPVWLASWRNR